MAASTLPVAHQDSHPLPSRLLCQAWKATRRQRVEACLHWETAGLYTRGHGGSIAIAAAAAYLLLLLTLSPWCFAHCLASTPFRAACLCSGRASYATRRPMWAAAWQSVMAPSSTSASPCLSAMASPLAGSHLRRVGGLGRCHTVGTLCLCRQPFQHSSPFATAERRRHFCWRGAGRDQQRVQCQPRDSPCKRCVRAEQRLSFELRWRHAAH